jgi:hypothetical protein
MHMPTTAAPAQTKALTWTGRVLSGLPAAFLLFDAALKFVRPAVVVDTTVKLGYAEAVILPLGVILLACTLLYLVPRTAIVGAILLTGYLGGAVNTHVHARGTAFEILFPILFGALLWLGLVLRTPRLRAAIVNL